MNISYKTTVSSCEANFNELKKLLAMKKQQDEKIKTENNQCLFDNGTQIAEDEEKEEIFEDAISSPILPKTTLSNLENGFASNEDIKIIPNREIKKEKNYITKLLKNQPSVEKTNNNEQSKSRIDSTPEKDKTKENNGVIHTCEDRLTELVALIQHKRKNTPKVPETIRRESLAREIVSEPPNPISIGNNDKLKTACNLFEMGKKRSLFKNTNGDMQLAHKIDNVASLNNSPTVNTPLSPKSVDSAVTNFNTLAGRIHSLPITASKSSFEVVFIGRPRTRKDSDCDSEYSFICQEFPPVTDQNDTGYDTISQAESEVSDFIVLEQTGNQDDSFYAYTDSVMCHNEIKCTVETGEVTKEESLLERREVDAKRSKTPENKKGLPLLFDRAKKLFKKNPLPQKPLTW